MRVDIIIPTYKPDDTFCLLLQKLQEQTFVIHELILVPRKHCGMRLYGSIRSNRFGRNFRFLAAFFT